MGKNFTHFTQQRTGASKIQQGRQGNLCLCHSIQPKFSLKAQSMDGTYHTVDDLPIKNHHVCALPRQPILPTRARLAPTVHRFHTSRRPLATAPDAPMSRTPLVRPSAPSGGYCDRLRCRWKQPRQRKMRRALRGRCTSLHAPSI